MFVTPGWPDFLTLQLPLLTLMVYSDTDYYSILLLLVVCVCVCVCVCGVCLSFLCVLCVGGGGGGVGKQARRKIQF